MVRRLGNRCIIIGYAGTRSSQRNVLTQGTFFLNERVQPATCSLSDENSDLEVS